MRFVHWYFQNFRHQAPSFQPQQNEPLELPQSMS
jgi:hypothetical protein